MDDARVWTFEQGLWTGDADHYRELVDKDCLMVLPAEPHILGGSAAIEAVAKTPRWTSVDITEGQISRPEEGLIVVAYKAHAEKDGEAGYEAWCTSTYRRLEHDVWRVVQHQQTPPLSLR